VKVFGPDLAGIQDLGVKIEKALTDLPDTRSVFAERTTGGYFLDFTVNRRAAARYGLTVGDVNDVIETAIGGNTIATTVEGRERYPISVRYARDYRGDIDALKRVLVATPMGGQVPIGEIADLSYHTGPPSIRDENGQLVGFVFVDVTTDNIDGYVQAAGARIAQRIQFPPGYYIQWAGQFEYLKSAEQRLAVVIPFTLLIIFVLIYLNTKSVARTAIVLLAVPFSLVGAFWLLYLLHYNLSVAVWVGMIALAGLDAETGVVMLLYLDHAWDKFQAAGRLNTPSDLHDAIMDGAVQRIRPKVMTVCAILFGLLPIMWSPTTQAGADVMKRIAAPMIGGVVTSAILELLLYPVIYMLWRRRHLPNPEGPGKPTSREGTGGKTGHRGVLLIVVAVLGLAAAAGALRHSWPSGTHSAPPSTETLGPPIATQSENGLKVNLYRAEGPLGLSENDVLIEFRDAASDAPADVGAVKFALDMNMPGMAMHSGGTVSPGGGPGLYRLKVKPEMAGDWSAQLQYDGPRGTGQISFTINVRR